MRRCLGLMGVVLLALVGCVGPQARLQMAEDAERDKDLQIKTVGDVTDVANVSPLQVSGIGLVTNLNGTGGTPQGEFRAHLEQYLRKRKVEDVKKILDSPDNALVLITALIPAGIRRGERFDVEVWLPPGSKATSLAGGYLEDCDLKTHDTSKNLSPEFKGSNFLLQGHTLAKARGPLLVGFGANAEPAELRRARVWQGCTSLVERPFYFQLKKDDKSARIANAVADRLNFMFQEDPQRVQKLKQELTQQQKNLLVLGNVADQINNKFDASNLGASMAHAASKEIIEVRIPYAYRFNPERYLLVARQVPLREEGEQHGRYRRRLQKMLTEPTETVRAALRLEALGKESVPMLQKGLAHEHALVRFSAAEALAYLGTTAGVEELARLAQEHPIMTNYCLMALAGLDESICRTKLSELLASDDTELRCGAFFALRLLDERDPRLGGELLNQSFWLHKVATRSSRLVNFAVSKRAEVVLFGDNVAIVRPIRTRVGQDFVLAMEPGDDRCTVSQITAQGGKKYKQCPPRVEDVIRTLADMGAEYPDVVDLMKKLDENQCVNCAVKVNVLPPQVPMEVLVEAGRNNALVGRDAAILANRKQQEDTTAVGTTTPSH
jgi:Flagellar P-ring protein